MNKVIPIILAGGTGSRLWPLSRESFPKQFLTLLADESDSLMQKTIKRIQKIDNLEEPVLVCNHEHRFIVRNQLENIKVKAKSIFLEPFSINTAPAIAIAALNEHEIIKILISSSRRSCYRR